MCLSVSRNDSAEGEKMSTLLRRGCFLMLVYHQKGQHQQNGLCVSQVTSLLHLSPSLLSLFAFFSLLFFFASSSHSVLSTCKQNTCSSCLFLLFHFLLFHPSPVETPPAIVESAEAVDFSFVRCAPLAPLVPLCKKSPQLSKQRIHNYQLIY